MRCTASVSAGHVVDATVVVEEKAKRAPLAKRGSLAAAGSPWLAPRLKWTRSTEATTLPADAVALPGGVSIARVDRDGATDVVVRADDVSLTRSYDASGALVAISAMRHRRKTARTSTVWCATKAEFDEVSVLGAFSIW